MSTTGDNEFFNLWKAALKEPDRAKYLRQWGTNENASCIWDTAHMELADIRKIAGMSQAEFAQRFCISRRTVEGWEGHSRCPDHTKLMIAELLGLIQR